MLSNLQGYFRPKSIPEALALLEKNSGSILVIAGGTKLVLSRNDTVQELVDITALNLNYVKTENSVIRIGATTPLQAVVESPALKDPSHLIVSNAALLSQQSRMVRNMSTIGGELLSTDSLSPLYCALLALQAQVRIAGGEEFALPLNIFLSKKNLAGGLLIEILIPKPAELTFSAISVVKAIQGPPPLLCACARVSLAHGRCTNVKLAMTGTLRIPQRLHYAEPVLEGKALTGANIESVADKVYERYQAISDASASEEFRKEVSRLTMKKALTKCLEAAETRL